MRDKDRFYVILAILAIAMLAVLATTMLGGVETVVGDFAARPLYQTGCDPLEPNIIAGSIEYNPLGGTIEASSSSVYTDASGWTHIEASIEVCRMNAIYGAKAGISAVPVITFTDGGSGAGSYTEYLEVVEFAAVEEFDTGMTYISQFSYSEIPGPGEITTGSVGFATNYSVSFRARAQTADSAGNDACDTATIDMHVKLKVIPDTCPIHTPTPTPTNTPTNTPTPTATSTPTPTITMTPAPDCPPGYQLIDGQCMAYECQAYECDDGWMCFVDPDGPECRRQLDPCDWVICPDGYICEGGECVPLASLATPTPFPTWQPTNPCEDVECELGEICEDGVCVDFPSPGSFCLEVECPAGYICYRGKCFRDGKPGDPGFGEGLNTHWKVGRSPINPLWYQGKCRGGYDLIPEDETWIIWNDPGPYDPWIAFDNVSVPAEYSMSIIMHSDRLLPGLLESDIIIEGIGGADSATYNVSEYTGIGSSLLEYHVPPATSPVNKLLGNMINLTITNEMEVYPPEGPPPNLYIESICIHDVTGPDDCVNLDPDVNFPPEWIGTGIVAGGEATMGYNVFGDPEYVAAMVSIGGSDGAGNYYVEYEIVNHDGVTGGVEFLLGGVPLMNHTVSPWQTAQGTTEKRWLDVADYEPLRVQSAPGRTATVGLLRACVKRAEDATPTPTPTPPPSDFDTSQCANPDPAFRNKTWQLNDRATYNSSWLDIDVGGGAQHETTMPAGTYRAIVRARTTDDRGIRAIMTDGSTGQTVLWSVPNSTIWHTLGEIEVALPSNPILNLSSLPNSDIGTLATQSNEIVSVDIFCLIPVDEPDSTPTPPPTPIPPLPTFTPTPATQPPSGCLNDDPGLDDPNAWDVAWGLAKSEAFNDGVVTLRPAMELMTTMPKRYNMDYTIDVKARTASDGRLSIFWQGSLDEFTVADGSDWQLYSRYWAFGGGSGTLVKPLTPLLDDPRGPSPFISPLRAPGSVSPLVTPPPPSPRFTAAYNNAINSPDTLTFRAQDYNAENIEIESICVRVAGVPIVEDDDDDSDEFRHPTCERDYYVRTEYGASLHPALLIGPGRIGMPVHAIQSGQIAEVDHTYRVGGVKYDGCVTLDHGDGLQSISCNLDPITVPPGGAVPRGATMGFTGEDHGGLLLAAMTIDGEVVNPSTRYVTWGDCRPYRVIVQDIARCDADRGNTIVQPRWNLDPPLGDGLGEWTNWLSTRLYDTVAYPILCSLMPVLDEILNAIEDLANSLIEPAVPALTLAYQIGRLIEYLIMLVNEMIRLLIEVFRGLIDAVGYIREVAGYLIAAMSDAVANEDQDVFVAPESSDALQVVTWVLSVIDQSFISYILMIAVIAIISLGSWRLVAWGLRRLIGAVDQVD